MSSIADSVEFIAVAAAQGKFLEDVMQLIAEVRRFEKEIERLTRELAEERQLSAKGVAAVEAMVVIKCDLERQLTEAKAKIDMQHKIALNTGKYQREEARTAAIEEAAKWHDQRARDTPDAFEMEFHNSSATAIRALVKP